MKDALKVCYVALLISIILLSWSFAWTNGFAYGADRAGALLYTKDLTSSGSNDNFSIEIGKVLFLVPLILRIAFWRRKAGWIEWLVLSGIWLYEGVLLLTLDSGSIVKTILHDKNIVLQFWIISCFLVMPLFAYFTRKAGGEEAQISGENCEFSQK
jgi:hypothetical protein